MFKIFGFGRDKTVEAPRSQLPSEQSTTTRQHTDIQRELVRVVLKDTLRIHGIPAAWLSCEVLALTGRARGDDMMVRLIVLKWHEPLLKFMPALQSELVVGLDRFEPAIDHSKYIVSWQFAPDCGCPYTQMPDARTWNSDGAPASGPLATPAAMAPTATSVPQSSPAPPPAPPATPSIVDWQPNTARAAGAANGAPAVHAPSVTQPAAAAVKPKFDLPASERDTKAQAFAATEPSALGPNTAPAPLSEPAKPRFDLPPSNMDKLPTGFAPTEPGPLR